LRGLEHALAWKPRRTKHGEKSIAATPGLMQQFDEVVERKSPSPVLRAQVPANPGFIFPDLGSQCSRLCKQATQRAPGRPIGRIEQEIDRLAIADPSARTARVPIDRLRQWHIVDRESHANPVGQAKPLAGMDLASCDMCPHGAAESLEVGQGDAGMAKPGRLADKFLGMTGATEKAVIAGNGDLAPASLRCTPAWLYLMSRQVRRMLIPRSESLSQRMLPELDWWLFGHDLPPCAENKDGKSNSEGAFAADIP
jgi:hypothetical protein